MTLRHPSALTLAILITSVGWLALPARGQNAPAQESSSPAVNSQEAARRKILESDRWQHARRELDHWLSVQQIYRPEEVATMKAELAARVAKMSPDELEHLLKDMEERLAVLTSPEAEDARTWLADFFAVARNPEQQLGRSRPDVLNMSASQIRQELQWLQQHRGARQQSQAAFNQGRALQVQSAQQVQTTRTQGREQFQNRPAATVNTPVPRSQYAPQRELRPKPMGLPLIYDIGPWGTPILWHPLNDFR